jgi:hypothetical protein
MNKYALINNQNVIENVISWDGTTEWTPPENMTCINIEGIDCGIGWTYDGIVFTAPPEPTQPT